jgi:hypothetical protein
VALCGVDAVHPYAVVEQLPVQHVSAILHRVKALKPSATTLLDASGNALYQYTM